MNDEELKKSLRERIIEVLKTVYDPEIPVDIWELGLVYDIDIDDDYMAHIKLTLTTPACPVAGSLPGEVETAAGLYVMPVGPGDYQSSGNQHF